MDCYSADALICLKDDLGLEYVVSEIEYKLWKNEEFEYRFRPNYSVIELLDSSVFQGIPGIDLDLHKKEYVRRNTIPTFISERSPGPNRENLWQLLDDCDMEYLNRLEWLIKTDTKYIGDRLYVREKNVNILNLINIDYELSCIKRNCDIQKRLLQYICSGMNVEYEGFIINNGNRKICYDLLYRLYKREFNHLKKLQNNGIDKAKANGKYKGRKPIQIDDTKLYEVWVKYANNKITLKEATEILAISESTFYRRIKKFK